MEHRPNSSRLVASKTFTKFSGAIEVDFGKMSGTKWKEKPERRFETGCRRVASRHRAGKVGGGGREGGEVPWKLGGTGAAM